LGQEKTGEDTKKKKDLKLPHTAKGWGGSVPKILKHLGALNLTVISRKPPNGEEEKGKKVQSRLLWGVKKQQRKGMGGGRASVSVRRGYTPTQGSLYQGEERRGRKSQWDKGRGFKKTEGWGVKSQTGKAQSKPNNN